MTSITIPPSGAYYIYKVSHCEFDRPWYIGISKSPEQRLQQHLTGNKAFLEMLNYVRETFPPDTSLDVELEIIDEAEDIEEARRLERTWIMREVPMLNVRHNRKYRALLKQYELSCEISDLLTPYIPDSTKRNELLRKLVDLIEKAGK